MGLFPRNFDITRYAQSDVPGTRTLLKGVVEYAPGAMVAEDTNYFVESVAMKVGAYTLAHNAPPRGARNVTVTQTTVGGVEDTNGTITVTGKNLAGATISEVLTPNAGATVAGAKAFAEITSIVGAGWVRDAGAGSEDTVVLGFGDVIGLPDKLTDTAQVLTASKNRTKEATAPTVTVSTSALESNTVDLNSAMDGDAIAVYYII